MPHRVTVKLRAEVQGDDDYVRIVLTPTVVSGRRPIPPEICTLKWPTPFEHNDFDQYTCTHSASTVTAGEKCPILALIRSRTRAFQRAICEPCIRRTLLLSLPKGGTKREFLHTFALSFISSLRVIVDISNFVCRCIIVSPSLYGRQSVPKWAWSRHVMHLKLSRP